MTRTAPSIACCISSKANDYSTVTAWMQVGEAVAEFAKRTGDFSREWNRLTKATKISAGARNTSAEIEHDKEI